MKKHKNKIIAAAVIIAALTVAWIYGGNYNKSTPDTSTIAAAQPLETSSGPVGSGNGLTLPSPVNTAPETPVFSSPPATPVPDRDQGIAVNGSESGRTESALPEASDLEGGEQHFADSGDSEARKDETGTQNADEAGAEQNTAGSGEPSDTGEDTHQTDPAADGRPDPGEPDDTGSGDDGFTVTLTVRCDMILNNMNLLNREKHELIPEDGVIFPATVVTAYEGESVFNVLQREMRRARIHMAFRNTPIYNAAYIEAINNIYEFDVGELSGWIYCVNGWYPNYGCSRFQLHPGDVIEWNYTCDLGHDLGEYWINGGQIDD